MVSPEDIHTDNIMYGLNMLSGIYKHTHRHTYLYKQRKRGHGFKSVKQSIWKVLEERIKGN